MHGWTERFDLVDESSWWCIFRSLSLSLSLFFLVTLVVTTFVSYSFTSRTEFGNTFSGTQSYPRHSDVSWRGQGGPPSRFSQSTAIPIQDLQPMPGSPRIGTISLTAFLVAVEEKNHCTGQIVIYTVLCMQPITCLTCGSGLSGSQTHTRENK